MFLGRFLVYIKQYVARVLRVRVNCGSPLFSRLALFDVPILGHAHLRVERHGHLVLKVRRDSWLGHLVWQGGKLAICLVHGVHVEAWRVVFYCWIFAWDEQVVLLPLIPLVWDMEPCLAAIRVVHLLNHDIPKNKLLSTALLPPHPLWDIVGGFERVVEASACLCDGVVRSAFPAQKRGLRGCEHFEVYLEPANSLGIAQELEELDFVDLSFLKDVPAEPRAILINERLLLQLLFTILQGHSLSTTADQLSLLLRQDALAYFALVEAHLL